MGFAVPGIAEPQLGILPAIIAARGKNAELGLGDPRFEFYPKREFYTYAIIYDSM